MEETLALEDAIVLAECQCDLTSTDDAFVTYQALRRSRAERLVAYAQQIDNHKRIRSTTTGSTGTA